VTGSGGHFIGGVWALARLAFNSQEWDLRIHAAKLTRWGRFFSDIPIYFGKPCYGLWGHMGITWSH